MSPTPTSFHVERDGIPTTARQDETSVSSTAFEATRRHDLSRPCLDHLPNDHPSSRLHQSKKKPVARSTVQGPFEYPSGADISSAELGGLYLDGLEEHIKFLEACKRDSGLSVTIQRLNRFYRHEGLTDLSAAVIVASLERELALLRSQIAITEHETRGLLTVRRSPRNAVVETT